MKIMICVDGLAGHPQTTFKRLKGYLASSSCRVALADTSRVQTFEDRVQLVIEYYRLAIDSYPRAEIFLVGQSAGGLAVLTALSRVYEEGIGKGIAGVILLSPALPRFYNYMTRSLFQVMRAHLGELLFGKKPINLNPDEYRSLIKPMGGATFEEVCAARLPISVVEARKLAFFPPKLGNIRCPIFHAYGDSDNWINPEAQRKFAIELMKGNDMSTSYEAPEAGHITILSGNTGSLIIKIQDWIYEVLQSYYD